MNLISVTEFDSESMCGIYSTILKFSFDKRGVNPTIKGLQQAAVGATSEVYEAALATLLPTPAKSHYLFNLRDFGRVILGVCMANTEGMTSNDQLVRLWCHEVMRVFYDRLTDDKDRNWFIELLRTKAKSKFSQDIDKIFEHLMKPEDENKVGIPCARRLLFGDFGNPEGKRTYEEMKDPAAIIEVCNGFLEDFNATSKKPMQLVLFLYMIEHIVRICRILRSPGKIEMISFHFISFSESQLNNISCLSGGNALLVGIGGSGRQSCTRLASSIMDYQVFEIEISKTYGRNEWREVSLSTD
jgi:dynein heavy chain, axonemal